MNNELAGFGGTEKFTRNNFGAGQYWSVAEKTVLALSGNAGIVAGIDQRVRITERYFLGGETLRGFATAGVSPRDASTGDALGGTWQAMGTLQLRFPLGLPEEFGLAGQVFTDFGTIGPTDVTSGVGTVNESSMIRASIGTGVAWKSPMGPVTADFAIPINKEAFDKTELFRFNFGTRF